MQPSCELGGEGKPPADSTNGIWSMWHLFVRHGNNMLMLRPISQKKTKQCNMNTNLKENGCWPVLQKKWTNFRTMRWETSYFLKNNLWICYVKDPNLQRHVLAREWILWRHGCRPPGTIVPRLGVLLGKFTIHHNTIYFHYLDFF